MTTRPPEHATVAPDISDDAVLCYCTNLTFGMLRTACRERRWPLPDKERTGKLCTGCMGDLLLCLRWFAPDAR